MIFWLRSCTFVLACVFFLCVTLKLPLLLLRKFCSAHKFFFVMLMNFFVVPFPFPFPFPCRSLQICPHDHWSRYLGCPDCSNTCNSLSLCCSWMRMKPTPVFTMTSSSAAMCHWSDATFTQAIRTKGNIVCVASQRYTMTKMTCARGGIVCRKARETFHWLLTVPPTSDRQPVFFKHTHSQ